MRRRLSHSVIFLLLVGGFSSSGAIAVSSQALPAAAGPSGRSGVVSTDFNADGYADVAIGVPFEDVNGHNAAGGVNVLYGSSGGLSAGGNQFWTQDSPGILDDAENGDEFGRRLGAGDFDGDGYSDLAIGVPVDSLGTINGAGAVNVLYGSPTGLTSNRNQVWTQDSPGILDQAEVLDTLGFAVFAGDFDGDGFDDLAIGAPGEILTDLTEAGSINVLYGGPEGLASVRNQLWTEDSPGVPDRVETNDRFGDRVKTGDFNGDGFDDLIGEAQREDVGEVVDAGAFIVLYGSASGLTADGSRFWTQDSPGVPERAEEGDLFAEYATSADFDGDGFDDLALGVPGESVGTVARAGVVHILFGSQAGLTADRTQLWSQNSPGILDRAEPIDSLGRCVIGGDFNGDGFADLAIGVQFEDVDDVVDSGAANVLYGSPIGLTATGNQFWTQDQVGDVAEEGDQFGRYGGWADYDSDGFPDLALGAPFEDVVAVTDAGAANVLYGSSAGLTATGSQYWTQDSPGIDDRADPMDELGRYFTSAS